VKKGVLFLGFIRNLPRHLANQNMLLSQRMEATRERTCYSNFWYVILSAARAPSNLSGRRDWSGYIEAFLKVLLS